MTARVWAAAFAAVLLAACSRADMTMDESLKPRAQEAYNRLVTDQIDPLFASMDKQFDTPQQRQTMKVLENFVPAGQSSPAKLIGWRWQVQVDGTRQQVFIYRYDYPESHVTFITTFARRRNDPDWKIWGFNIGPSPEDQVTAPMLDEGSAPPLKPEPKAK